jgi:hypothetical protein
MKFSVLHSENIDIYQQTMKLTDIFVRTEQGNNAVKSNTPLNSKHRMLFIMIDGKLTVAQLLEQCKRLGIDDNAIESLEKSGYIYNNSTPLTAATVSNSSGTTGGIGENFYEVQNFMRQTVTDAAGIRAYFFMLKIEGAMNIADLKSLLPDYEKTLKNGLGETAAKMLIDKLKSMF